MTAPITIPSLAELRRRYEETTDAQTRTRYQMLLLSLRGQTSGQIAKMSCEARIRSCASLNGSSQAD